MVCVCVCDLIQFFFPRLAGTEKRMANEIKGEKKSQQFRWGYSTSVRERFGKGDTIPRFENEIFICANLFRLFCPEFLQLLNDWETSKEFCSKSIMNWTDKKCENVAVRHLYRSYKERYKLSTFKLPQSFSPR